MTLLDMVIFLLVLSIFLIGAGVVVDSIVGTAIRFARRKPEHWGDRS